MLMPISADEVDLSGKALAVYYKEDPDHADLLLVNITAYVTDGDREYIEKSEMRLVAIQEPMPKDALHARVRAEAERRQIERVAWIREA